MAAQYMLESKVPLSQNYHLKKNIFMFIDFFFYVYHISLKQDPKIRSYINFLSLRLDRYY